jgi:membrane-associated phospholipid phosphatase
LLGISKAVRLRPGELVLVGYFTYIAGLAVTWRLAPFIQLLALLLPLAVLILAYLESTHGSKATGVAREWLPPCFVLIAYQEVRWFQRPFDYALERRWVEWDRVFLDNFRARGAIESMGAAMPLVLDLSYLLVYAIPPVALAILYRCRHRSGVDQFLFTLLLGTLLTYALLPFFPSAPPRTAFPGQDLPTVHTVLRRFNVWMLDRYDIQTSVFPSGHVTAAFSAAFGMLLAFPQRKRFGASLLILAFAIALTTVYGRYHYLVDGAAGLLIAIAAACLSAAVFSPAWRPATSNTSSVSPAHAGS